MILATYLPCKKSHISNFKCFSVENVEDMLVKSFCFNSEYNAEDLVVFNTTEVKEKEDGYYVESLPNNFVKIPLGAVIMGDAFVMDSSQTELEPLKQSKKREKCEQYIHSKLKKIDNDADNEYAMFLIYQKIAFESFLLPLWAPFLFAKLTGETYPVNFDAELTCAEADAFANNLKENVFNKEDFLHAYYSKGMNANDSCWCGSGKKMKKCHGR